MFRMKKAAAGVLSFLLAVNVAYVISGVVNFGLSSIDASAIWLFKAKAIFLAGGIPWDYLRNPAFIYQHPQYPLGLPFLISTLYGVSGSVDEVAVLLWYPVVYVAILWLCYEVVRKLGAELWLALGFTYLYSLFSPLLAGAGRRHAGEADIILTLIAWFMICCIQRMEWSKKQTNILSWGVTLLIIIASQIKMEGIFFLPFLWFLPTSKVQKYFQTILAFLPFVAWTYFVKVSGFPADFGFVIPSFSELFQRLLVIGVGYGREFVQVHQWYAFWPVFFLTLFVWPQSHLWIKKRIWVPLILMVGLFTLVYLTTSLDTQSHLLSSIDRVFLQLSPWFFVIWVDRVIGRIGKGKRE